MEAASDWAKRIVNTTWKDGTSLKSYYNDQNTGVIL